MTAAWRTRSMGLALFAANIAIVWPLLFLEYSAYTGSIEGTFIALARLMAKHPGAWSWWPFWNCGMPYENAYLPLTHWMAALLHMAGGISAAHAFHIVSALFYAAAPVSLFWMALEFSRRPGASFAAAAVFTCVPLSGLLFPAIAADMNGALNLRRLHVLVVWGEAPHGAVLALLPVAMVLVARALTRPQARWKILAGMAVGAVVLCNAFGAVALAFLVAAWLAAYGFKSWWKAALIGIASLCWVSPWLSPNMIGAMRANSATAGGDFRYTAMSYAGMALIALGGVVLWRAVRGLPDYARFFALAAYTPTAVVTLWYAAHVHVLPQPARYHLELDMLLPLPLVFAVACIKRGWLRAAFGVALLALCGNAAVYSRTLIRAADAATLSEYKIAKWLEANRPGERTFVTGSASMLLNAFTDTPQMLGGHTQHITNPLILIADYTIRAGTPDGETAIFWLKAMGVRSVAVSGPGSTEHFRDAYIYPRKFEGLLPVLWRDGDDTIYATPLRTASLAHVIPANAVVARRPIHGLDIEPVRPFVNALDAEPRATLRWLAMDHAAIHANMRPGEVLAVQTSYAPGWEARIHGAPRPVHGDGLGQVIIDAACSGACDVDLRYTGGPARTLTRLLSCAAMLAAAVLAWRGATQR